MLFTKQFASLSMQIFKFIINFVIFMMKKLSNNRAILGQHSLNKKLIANINIASDRNLIDI